MTNVVSNLQANKIKIQRKNFGMKWKFQTGSGIISSPAIGFNGTIYVGSQDSYLYAITPDGKLKWKFQTGSQIYSSPAIGLDGTVYVGSQDSYLYAITLDGKLKWKFQTGGAVSSSPAIGSDDTIYVGSRDYSLYAITTDGKLKWKVYIDRYSSYDYKHMNSISSVVIGVDGTIYVASYMAERNKYSDWYYYSYNLFAISTDGKIKWCLPISVGSSTYGLFYSEIISSPVIGLGNFIYLTHSSENGFGYLHIVTYDGKTNESLKLEKGTDSSLTIGTLESQ